jgi:hypothetical protein
MDLWALLLRYCFGVRSLDYGLFGRWIGHLVRGQFMHDNIAKSPRVSGGRIIGCTFHYLIGILLASLLMAFWGLQWARQPSLAPALIIDVGTIVPLISSSSPAWGWVLAASRIPQPTTFRLRSLATHCVYGFGLYGSAVTAGWNYHVGLLFLKRVHYRLSSQVGPMRKLTRPEHNEAGTSPSGGERVPASLDRQGPQRARPADPDRL